MGSNKPTKISLDADEGLERAGESSFEDEMDAAFSELEAKKSHTSEIDPALRQTLPDIDGIILQTNAGLAPIEELTEEDAIDPPESERDTMPPPVEDYDSMVRKTAEKDEVIVMGSIEGTAEPSPKSTKKPEGLEFEQIFKDAFGKTYQQAVKGNTLISEPPPSDILNEAMEQDKILAEIESGRPPSRAPDLEVEEAPLSMQIEFDTLYIAAKQPLSYFNEIGINPLEMIELVEEFNKNRPQKLTPDQITDVLMIFIKNLTQSLLVELDKRKKHECDGCMAYAAKIVKTYEINDRADDKVFILGLRTINLIAIFYETRAQQAQTLRSDLYDEFVAAKLTN